jgi:hypothetical protein
VFFDVKFGESFFAKTAELGVLLFFLRILLNGLLFRQGRKEGDKIRIVFVRLLPLRKDSFLHGFR